jgi:hypothetical protein
MPKLTYRWIRKTRVQEQEEDSRAPLGHGPALVRVVHNTALAERNMVPVERNIARVEDSRALSEHSIARVEDSRAADCMVVVGSRVADCRVPVEGSMVEDCTALVAGSKAPVEVCTALVADCMAVAEDSRREQLKNAKKRSKRLEGNSVWQTSPRPQYDPSPFTLGGFVSLDLESVGWLVVVFCVEAKRT